MCQYCQGGNLRIRVPGYWGEGRDSPEEPGGVNFQQQRGLPAGPGAATATAPSGRTPQLFGHTHPGTELGLRKPGGARGPARNKPELARCMAPSPSSRSGGSSKPGPSPDCSGPPAALHPRSLPSGLPHAHTGPGSRARPDTGSRAQSPHLTRGAFLEAAIRR